jgi:hypothetical protein
MAALNFFHITPKLHASTMFVMFTEDELFLAFVTM